MRVLASRIAPLNEHRLQSFSDAFVENFFRSTHVSMVAGYASADAVVTLNRLIEKNDKLQSFDLVVGMAHFDGIFSSQFDALTDLDSAIYSRSVGGVHIARAVPVHAKASAFGAQSGTHAAIVGSSNLSGLVGTFRQFELDVLIQDPATSSAVHRLVRDICEKGSVPISSAAASLVILENPNLVLEGIPGVEKVDPQKFIGQMTATSFSIPIKPEPKSHLNVFFGAGRRQSGHEIPRHWYEVELIVGVEIARQEGYPQAGSPTEILDVITDDGWRFSCQVQGQNSKNFRSVGDLKILGKWIKERLQNSGALRIGEPVTAHTLLEYGRADLELTKLNGENQWFLDFSRPHA